MLTIVFVRKRIGSHHRDSDTESVFSMEKGKLLTEFVLLIPPS